MIERLRRNEGSREQIFETFHKGMMEVERGIEEKYQTTRPKQEARLDALVYASSQLGWYKLAPFHPDPDLRLEGTEEADRMAEQWEQAINETRIDDWSPMRRALQGYARSSAEDAALKEEMRQEIYPAMASGEHSERMAKAFINLITSL